MSPTTPVYGARFNKHILIFPDQENNKEENGRLDASSNCEMVAAALRLSDIGEVADVEELRQKTNGRRIYISGKPPKQTPAFKKQICYN